MFRRCVTARTLLAALALGGIIFMVGCGGLSQRPLAPDRAAVTNAPSKALPRLALTLTTVEARSDSGLVSPSLEVSSKDTLDADFPEYGDPTAVRVEKVKFKVEKGSVDKDCKISMTAFSGSTVNDVKVDFGPDGLVFSQPATLTIWLWGSLNSDRLKAYHTASDGTKTEIPFTLSSLGDKRWRVIIQVPGFSEYSLGDDLIPEGDLP